MKLITGLLALIALSSFTVDAMASNDDYPGVHILQYHHVSDSTPAVTSITPEQFEQHLKYLKDNNFNVVDIEQAATWVDEGASIPAKTVVSAPSTSILTRSILGHPSFSRKASRVVVATVRVAATPRAAVP